MHGAVPWNADINAVKVEDPPKKEPQRPTFKARWWHRHNRIDVRPVIWSLINKPQDWKLSRPYYYWRGHIITHVTTRHDFRVGKTPFSCRMDDTTRCECQRQSNGGRFQPFQKLAFWMAAKSFISKHEKVDQNHFANHF